MVGRYGLELRLSVDLKVEYHATVIEFGRAACKLCPGLREFVDCYFSKAVKYKFPLGDSCSIGFYFQFCLFDFTKILQPLPQVFTYLSYHWIHKFQ